MTQSIKNSCSSGKAVFKLWESRKGWHWSQRSADRPEKVLQNVVHPNGIVRLQILLSSHQLGTGRETAKPIGTPRSTQCSCREGVSSARENSVLRHLQHPPNLGKWINISNYVNHLKLKCEPHEYEKDTNSYAEMTNSSIRNGKNNTGA